MYYFIITTRYIHIKQNYCMKLIDSEAKKLGNFREVYRINAKIIKLFREISEYNRFWCKFITIEITFYTIQICYLTFSFLFYSKSFRMLFICLTVNFSVILLAIIWVCSMVVWKNRVIFRKLRSFIVRSKVQIRFRTVQLIKVCCC